MLEDVSNLILEMADIGDVKKTINEKLESGVDPLAIVDILSQTLEEVGEKYERGEFFLSELIMAGYLASEVSNLLKPHLIKAKRKPLGKLIVGTVKGDIHDIGKNIVIMMLDAAGFEVIDLGVDVSTERFIEAVKNLKPDILGMSALLTSTVNEVKVVIDSLEKSGLRNKVKVVVGGRAITREFANEIGADGYAEDSVKAIKAVKELLG